MRRFCVTAALRRYAASKHTCSNAYIPDSSLHNNGWLHAQQNVVLVLITCLLLKALLGANIKSHQVH